jgi:hypothetical protein
MLSPRDAFKVNFLARCVEAGMGPADIELAVKRASFAGAAAGSAGRLLGGALRIGGNLATGVGLPLALAAPPVIGGLGGYALARATDVDDTDLDEVKDREVMDEYRRQLDALARQRAARDYRQQRGRGRGPH